MPTEKRQISQCVKKRGTVTGFLFYITVHSSFISNANKNKCQWISEKVTVCYCSLTLILNLEKRQQLDFTSLRAETRGLH